MNQVSNDQIRRKLKTTLILLLSSLIYNDPYYVR